MIDRFVCLFYLCAFSHLLRHSQALVDGFLEVPLVFWRDLRISFKLLYLFLIIFRHYLRSPFLTWIIWDLLLWLNTIPLSQIISRRHVDFAHFWESGFRNLNRRYLYSNQLSEWLQLVLLLGFRLHLLCRSSLVHINTIWNNLRRIPFPDIFNRCFSDDLFKIFELDIRFKISD